MSDVPKKKRNKAFLILLAVTIIDWIIPDPSPLVDELLLTLVTAIVGGFTYLPRQPKED